MVGSCRYLSFSLQSSSDGNLSLRLVFPLSNGSLYSRSIRDSNCDDIFLVTRGFNIDGKDILFSWYGLYGRGVWFNYIWVDTFCLQLFFSDKQTTWRKSTSFYWSLN